ncbi:MAG TPA: lipid A export permease/ATP-binding protein MsbA [Burkholderiaceae bacterium]|nr:lipid A export permease/ATP-binding protein MsbA [Burkholderiaceae bacterium]
MNALTKRLRRIWPYFAPSRMGFLLAALCTVVASVTDPMVAWLMQQLVDRGFKGGPGGPIPLWWVPASVIGLFALRGLAVFLSQYAVAWAAYRGTQAMRQALFRRVMEAHPDLFSSHSSSALTNIVAHEAQGGAVMLSNSGLALVRDLLTLVALFAYLLWMNWQLTLFVVVLFPVVAYAMRTLSRRLHRLTLEGQSASDQLAYAVEENVLAWRIVRLHNAQRQQMQRFNEMSDQMRRVSMKSVVAAATMTPLTQVLAATALSAVIVAVLWQHGQGGTTVGKFVGYVMAMLQLIAPIKRLSEVAVPITRGLASLDRGIKLIDDHRREAQGSYAPERATGTIRLEGVSVQYQAGQPPALDAIDLEVPAGQVVALVGPSGAGKSTLINVLARFVEPAQGRVLVDGHDLLQWDVVALRRQFALVSQDVVLFNDTVAANVALGHAVDAARVEAALAAANLLEFVRTLPEGLHTPVGHNGQRLSGGQRQRLAIARALYKDAPILILDEATSALDSESERLVQAALERLMAGRTSIVIAHRLSTVERADRIVVVEAGKIVQQGTRDELLARGGLFARLHALQFQG